MLQKVMCLLGDPAFTRFFFTIVFTSSVAGSGGVVQKVNNNYVKCNLCFDQNLVNKPV